MCEVAQVATLCEAVATEVRLGQISEIAEVFEPTGAVMAHSRACELGAKPDSMIYLL